MGTNSSQIRQDLSEVLSQNSANESHAARLLSAKMAAASQRRRRREKQRQRKREQRPSHRKQLKHNASRYYSNSFDESMDEVLSAMLMDAYVWEMMSPKERWEQEQLKELEGTFDFPL